MIAERDELQEWKELRRSLKDNHYYPKNPAWNTAIELFNKRLKTKYFDPIELIIKNGAQKGEGFTIVTVQCALIEALASFETGEVFKFDKSEHDSKFYYNDSKKVFTSFLRKASIFKGIFSGHFLRHLQILSYPY